MKHPTYFMAELYYSRSETFQALRVEENVIEFESCRLRVAHDISSQHRTYLTTSLYKSKIQIPKSNWQYPSTRNFQPTKPITI